MFDNLIHGMKILSGRGDVLALLAAMCGATMIVSATFNNLTVRRMVSMTMAILICVVGFHIGRIMLVGDLIAELSEGHALTAYLYLFSVSLISGLWLGKVVLIVTRTSRRKFWRWLHQTFLAASMKAERRYERLGANGVDQSLETVALRAHQIMASKTAGPEIVNKRMQND